MKILCQLRNQEMIRKRQDQLANPAIIKINLKNVQIVHHSLHSILFKS